MLWRDHLAFEGRYADPNLRPSNEPARIDARSDYWDPHTEPGERDFARQLGAARREELKAEAAAELAEFVGMTDVKEQIDL